MRTQNESGGSKSGSPAGENRSMSGANYARGPKDEMGLGRWPANVICNKNLSVIAIFPETGPSPKTYIRRVASGNLNVYSKGIGDHEGQVSLNFGDSGSAARFFKQIQEDSNE